MMMLRGTLSYRLQKSFRAMGTVLEMDETTLKIRLTSDKLD